VKGKMMASEDDTIVEDVNVAGVKPLIPPAILQDELPLTDQVIRIYWTFTLPFFTT
jgi:hypothetical protein